MNSLKKNFSSNVVDFLSKHFLNESEVLYLNGNIKKVKYFVTFLCQVGDLEFLRSLHFTSIDMLPQLACECGSIDILKWIVVDQSSYIPVQLCMRYAAENGHIHILEYLFEFAKSNLILDDLVFNDAVKQPNIFILEWLKNKHFQMSPRTFVSAAYAGHIHVLKWLLKNGCPLSEDVFKAAAISGDFNLLKWLKENHCPWNSDVFLYCIRTRNIHILKWLKDNHCPWNPDVNRQFVSFNYLTRDDLESFQWLVNNGYTFHNDAFQFVSSSDIEVLKWIYNNNYKMNPSLFGYCLACGADRNILQWILDHGGVLDSLSINYAVQSQNIDVLEWLLSLGCVIQNESVRTALVHKRIDNLKWLLNHGAKVSDIHSFSYAIETSGNIEILEYLKQHNCTFTPTTFLFTFNSPIEVLEWLRRDGCKLSRYDEPCIRVAWQHFPLEHLEWFKNHPDIFF